MRGILTPPTYTHASKRLTPAGAGNTDTAHIHARQQETHPRWRGEYTRISSFGRSFVDSPPFTRGMRRGAMSSVSLVGLTPAYAGNTLESFWIVSFTGLTPACAGNTTNDLSRVSPFQHVPLVNSQFSINGAGILTQRNSLNNPRLTRRDTI